MSVDSNNKGYSLGTYLSVIFVISLINSDAFNSFDPSTSRYLYKASDYF